MTAACADKGGDSYRETPMSKREDVGGGIDVAVVGCRHWQLI